MITACAPGSVMILGEHAVLHGYSALIMAVSESITVKLTSRDDKLICIESSLGAYQATLSALVVEKPFDYVLAVLVYYQSQLESGIDIGIVSTLQGSIGLGSSTAVVVAMVKALHALLGLACDEKTIMQAATMIIRGHAGRASGADVAASVLGGVVAFNAVGDAEQLRVEPLPVELLYSGKKVPTAEVLAFIDKRFSGDRHTEGCIYKTIGEIAKQGIVAVQQKEWEQLGKLMNDQHAQLQALGVSNHTLDNLCEHLRGQPNCLGAKISGAGMGDCVMGLLA